MQNGESKLGSLESLQTRKVKNCSEKQHNYITKQNIVDVDVQFQQCEVENVNKKIPCKMASNEWYNSSEVKTDIKTVQYVKHSLGEMYVKEEKKWQEESNKQNLKPFVNNVSQFNNEKLK